MVYYSLLVGFLHTLFSPTPNARNAEKLIGEIRPILVRVRQIGEPVAALSLGFFEFIKGLYIRRVMWAVLSIPDPFI